MKTSIIKTNKRFITCLALNHTGSLLATASKSGVKIKIFNTKTSQQLQKLCRGSGSANILYITFHRSSMFLACTSNKEAVHIFELYESFNTLDKETYETYLELSTPDEVGYENNKIALDQNVKNEIPALATVGALVSKYFTLHWSFSKAKINDAGKICAFGSGNNFMGKLWLDYSYKYGC